MVYLRLIAKQYSLSKFENPMAKTKQLPSEENTTKFSTQILTKSPEKP